jgi:hypothetical protein
MKLIYCLQLLLQDASATLPVLAYGDAAVLAHFPTSFNLIPFTLSVFAFLGELLGYSAR